jgi:hypothetical protein
LARFTIIALAALSLVQWEVIKSLDALTNRVEDVDTRVSHLSSGAPRPSGDLNQSGANAPEGVSPAEDNRQTSYVLQAVVEPNWDAILDRLAQEDGGTAEQLIEKCRNAAGEINPGGWGLWQQAFRFVIFSDLTSTREDIWSDHHRTFKENAVVQGYIFEKAAFRLDDAFRGSIERRFIASPSSLGFAGPWNPGGDVESASEVDDVLGHIPADQIVRLLLKLDRRGAAMNAIKTFPDDLDEELRRHSVEYSHEEFSSRHLGATFNDQVLDAQVASGRVHEQQASEPQLYSQRVVFHKFQTPFYALRLRFHGHRLS